MKLTKISWINRQGKSRTHSMGFLCTLAYARNWWRESIAACQGILSKDEQRASKLQFLEASPVSEA